MKEKEGFTEEELQTLESKGIDISFIKDNAHALEVAEAQGTKNNEDVLGEKDSINLNTYEAMYADIGDNNIQEGKFKVTKEDGEELDGFHTLDSITWLDKNYNFSDKDKGKGRFAKEENIDIEALDLTDKVNNVFMPKANELRESLDSLYVQYGYTSLNVEKGISARAKKEANIFAQDLNDKFEALQAAKEEKEKEPEKEKPEEK